MQTFAPFVYDAAYQLNKNYIAKTFCINKNKPQMHCNGKCYLAKQQQKEEDNQDKQTNAARKESFQISPFFLPETVTFISTDDSIKILYNELDKALLSNYHASVFHPPAV